MGTLGKVTYFKKTLFYICSIFSQEVHGTYLSVMFKAEAVSLIISQILFFLFNLIISKLTFLLGVQGTPTNQIEIPALQQFTGYWERQMCK